MDKQTILALKLKDYRDKNGLTQAQLAEQLEVSDKTISKWENGETYPSKRNMLIIAKTLEIDMSILLVENLEKKEDKMKILNQAVLIYVTISILLMLTIGFNLVALISYPAIFAFIYYFLKLKGYLS
ncbi:helix-turn-helix transcriptional regulator [Streptococcus dysgalactiae subsp. equisimilis]|uniref:helix-turn-helix domain-containing protein n=1 Tax=Streptococcus dysgalactiae TaxID=1334 RepID=UPI001F12DA55|nr:helix-turn-helix transcriptional regulator [Streptococcus dysgalactiae]MCL6222089.1 helix-turn-helix transcriptional regulator [Streptococcus dysgalactiae subsp. equisimilis]UMY68141.1 helix-turn-helix transcriptional regulator [Streptococcus dysgalactiae subsp. equisimilis]